MIRVKRGQKENLPTGYPGEPLMCLDNGEFYVGGNHGNVLINGPWVTPEAYGAKGDGVTDDTVAIQAAFTAANASKAMVVFSDKTYIINSSSGTILTDTALVAEDIVISGAGMGSTIIKLKDAGGNALNGLFATNCIVENMQWDGGFDPDERARGTYVLLYMKENFTVRGCYLKNACGTLIGDYNPDSLSGILGILENSTLENFADHAVYFGGGIAGTTPYASTYSDYNRIIRNNRILYDSDYQPTPPNANQPSIVIRNGIHGVLIDGNEILGGGVGIQVSFYQNYAANIPTGIRIVNNHIFAGAVGISMGPVSTGIDSGAVTDNGFRLTDVVISNNIIEMTPSSTAYLYPRGITVDNSGAVILGNRITGVMNSASSDGDGIGISYTHSASSTGTETVIVKGNYFSGCYRDISALAQGSIISGNVHDSAVNTAIVANYRQTIDGDTFNDCRIGINVGAGEPVTVTDSNKFSGSTLLDTYLDSPTAPIMSLHRQTQGTVSPAAGTWVVNDVCWNTSPGDGEYPGWVCTTAGTPGTWTPMAALGCVDQKVKTTSTPTFNNIVVSHAASVENISITTISSGVIPYQRAEGAEVVTDGALENWTSATNLTSWSEAISGTSTVNQATGVGNIHGGSSACRMDVDASNNYALIFQTVVLVSSNLCRLTFWYKSSTGKEASLFLYDTGANVYLDSDLSWGAYDGIVLPAVTAWTEYTLDFSSHASYTEYYLYVGTGLISNAASSSVYFDDISIKSIEVLADSPLSTDGTDVDNSGVYKVADVQVVGAQVVDARANDVANSGDATTDGLIDALRDAMIAHGLLAAA